MSFQIKPAVRIFQPVLIGLWGGSSSGKTYSALRLARGLVGPQGKIGVIDTENRRALFYAGKVGGQWDHIDFQPPFTPERYTEAFRAFEKAGGYSVVIIDSASHVWEGEGGVLDQADSSNTTGLAKWAKPKMALKRMINTLLRSGCHVIFCLRAKMGVAQDGRGKDAKIYSSGLEPIMEKNLIFEMTVSLLFGPDHKPLFQAAGERYFVNPIIPAIKAPEEILRAIKPDEYVSEATGKAIADWLSGATRDALDEARRMAARGTDAFRAWWPSLSKEDKGLLNQHIQELQAIAAKADVDAQAMDQDLSGAIGEEGGESSADDGNDDALSGGFDSFEDDEESAQVSEPQPVVSPAPVQTPVRPAVTQPPQRVQQTQTPPVTQPPRRAAAPQPSPAPTDLSTDDNPF
ncbi:AAA family ATPase [Candidatus Magnetaquicoccus inordinatus]|uniref:AAA family ATPase n=1 Tax=Candidatus Magnetaquicoccus inordinatus TaxID=2496818 RepID=UPI00102B802F|nr:AAA family ATPase [Candidatus Magnetaquicoccus inordinatus]